MICIVLMHDLYFRTCLGNGFNLLLDKIEYVFIT
jgi:hypothetical protein